MAKKGTIMRAVVIVTVVAVIVVVTLFCLPSVYGVKVYIK